MIRQSRSFVVYIAGNKLEDSEGRAPSSGMYRRVHDRRGIRRCPDTGRQSDRSRRGRPLATRVIEEIPRDTTARPDVTVELGVLGDARTRQMSRLSRRPLPSWNKVSAANTTCRADRGHLSGTNPLTV